MVDIVIVAMHWGNEYQLEPSWYQKDAAKFLADLGVDIVIGTHPHTVEPIEWIDNTLIIYSLGNFISAQSNSLDYMKLVGLMSSVDITKTIKGDETIIKISNLKNELLYTYYKNYRNFKVIPFSKINTNYLNDYQRIYDKYKKVVTKYDSSIQVN